VWVPRRFTQGTNSVSGQQLYQDVTDAELARERRYEKRRERAEKIDRKRRLADLRMAEEMEAADLAFSDTMTSMAIEWHAADSYTAYLSQSDV